MLDAGSGNSMATWRHVQAEVAKLTRACAYDWASLDFSDAAERPSDLVNIVDDLRRLGKAADLPTPFVHVGHSLAGAVGLLYVATYPDEVAGAVLAEPAFAAIFHRCGRRLKCIGSGWGTSPAGSRWSTRAGEV